MRWMLRVRPVAARGRIREVNSVATGLMIFDGKFEMWWGGCKRIKFVVGVVHTEFVVCVNDLVREGTT